ncbi:hypothetical protein PF005_g8329 [Phytophthora fragariae]|uniref:Uncharacterized protein n=1 Tax=Phytophthora fragariae TaxID=53985 RepID=A0A6A3YH67_9STRA|nr:hypothetical protein PF003_g26928 [Phytophthora fragariae]KAE8938270.1 hypothetical protein PF009_g11840 [Phytophthora fragariae]KAE8988524.1 hypothetical protein PF011_g19136 [Phytophthora fragariae]KAE9111009.1 hypothetical protein PF010_g10969 [Phytophthora fragariae]KAE9119421.1 hypothetical protein PF007_g8550 [Phytophthora fragariae]
MTISGVVHLVHLSIAFVSMFVLSSQAYKKENKCMLKNSHPWMRVCNVCPVKKIDTYVAGRVNAF